MNRVFITGAGIVSPFGFGFQTALDGIHNSQKEIGLIKNFNTEGYPTLLGAEVKKAGEVFISSKGIDRKEIFLDAVLEEITRYEHLKKYAPEERDINIGMGIDYFDIEGFSSNAELESKEWQGYSHNSFKIIKSLCEKNNITGGFSVSVSACVASSEAMGNAFRILKYSGDKKIIFTGGADSMLNPLHYMGFHKLGALSDWKGNPPEACRPFDKKRCGLVLGEGAALYMFENQKYAQPDTILAEVLGYGSTMDAYMVTDPEPEGMMLAKAAFIALNEAGIKPDDIDCVHCHGTGTYKNEPAEAKALNLIFGERFRELPVFSLKAQIGHLIAACGAMEIAGVLYSLKEQAVPVTANFEFPDPEIPLNVIKDKPLKMDIKHILKLNAAFGGQNTALVIKKYE